MMQLDQRCNLKPFKRCIIEQHADVKLPMHKRFLNLLTACYLHKGSTSAHPTVQPRPCLHALRLAGCNPRTHLLSHHTAPAPKSHKNTHPPRAALYSNHGMLSFPCFHLRSRSDIKSRHYYEHTKEQAPKKLLGLQSLVLSHMVTLEWLIYDTWYTSCLVHVKLLNRTAHCLQIYLTLETSCWRHEQIRGHRPELVRFSVGQLIRWTPRKLDPLIQAGHI